MRDRASSWLDQLVGACFSLLVGAAAVYLAALLLQAVWVWLIGIGGMVVLAAVVAAYVRRRRGGW